MENIETHEDLIDLGSASVETKGIGRSAQDTVSGQLQFPPSGLCAD